MNVNEILAVKDLNSLNELTYKLLKPQAEVKLSRKVIRDRKYLMSEEYLLPETYIKRMVSDNAADKVLENILKNCEDGIIDESIKVLQILQLLAFVNPVVANKISYIFNRLEIVNNI